jgi:hypothetical protein
MLRFGAVRSLYLLSQRGLSVAGAVWRAIMKSDVLSPRHRQHSTNVARDFLPLLPVFRTE